MKGLIIIGSAQVNSHTSALARYLTEHFKTHDIEAEIFDLAEKPLNQLDFSGTTPAIDEIKQNMKGLIIIGSAQVNSHTSALARYLTEHFKTHDIEA
ncbi:NAD(P)H-dependent oxidoreductase, partial [Staphylococcus aureus]|uniref:NAD(P)H-dependent oxidoreductase n=1 Tax=Staphylococcus aureus TaxID=1280 RepID=UPI00210CA946